MAETPSNDPRKGMDPSVQVAWITLFGTVLTAVIGGIFGLNNAGKKSNEALDRPTSFIANVQAGITLINSSKPASDSFPVNNVKQVVPVTIPAPQQPTIVPVAVPQPTPVLQADTGTSEEELQRCSGFEPLKVTRIHLQRTSDGYMAVVGLQNPLKTGVSVYSKWGKTPAQLTTDSGEALDSRSDLPGEGKFTFWNGAIKPDVWDQAFQMGDKLDANGSTTISARFNVGNPRGQSADLQLQLQYLSVDNTGTRGVKNLAPHCSTLPISAFNQQQPPR